MDLFARTLDLTVLILMFLPNVVFLAFLFGVAVYVWHGVRSWCQQAEGPWRERLVLPALFTLYWFLITYTIHRDLIRRWEGAPAFLPWVLLAAGIAVYLTDLRRPRFWALYYGAAELVFTLAERFGGRLLAGREMFVETGTLAGALLFIVVTGAVAGVLAFAVHFLAGLFLKLWEDNHFFWKGSAGVFTCLLLVGELWYHAPALAAAGFAQYVVPAGCLLVLLGAAFGYGATSEYCGAPLVKTAANPAAEGAVLLRWPFLRAGRARREEAAQEEQRELQRRVRDALKELRHHGFLLLSGVRVLGVREAEIDHLLMGPNGLWVIDAKNGPGRGRTRARMGGFRHGGPRRAGANGTLGSDPDQQIRDLKAFLQRYIGDLANQISFHYLACTCHENHLAWSHGSGEFQEMPPAQVRAQILRAPGTNPLPREMYPRIMILLLRETVDRTRRYLEEQKVPVPLPRLEPTKYENLGLSVLATDEEIDRRYGELSRQSHPNGGLDEISAAYAALRENRRAYEQWLWQEALSTLKAMQEIREKYRC